MRNAIPLLALAGLAPLTLTACLSSEPAEQAAAIGESAPGAKGDGAMYEEKEIIDAQSSEPRTRSVAVRPMKAEGERSARDAFAPEVPSRFLSLKKAKDAPAAAMAEGRVASGKGMATLFQEQAATGAASSLDAKVIGGLGTRGGGSGGGGYGAGASMAYEIAAPPPAAPANKNGWFQNTYQGGIGDRESLEKTIQEGVLVGGDRIKLAAFSSVYDQDYPLPSEGALGMTLRSDRVQPMPEGGSVFLEVGLQASATELGDRPDLDIILVIDTSGSMRDEGKIEAVRAAGAQVVERLREGDHLGVVTYSNDAKVRRPLGEIDDRDALAHLMASLEASGGTNIHEGLSRGYAELEARGRKTASPLVLLLSDGKVTAGQRSPMAFDVLTQEAAKNDIVTTSIGMGVSYDEDLMMAISQKGGGNYHFIKESGDVRAVVEREIDELSEALARAVRLRIELPKGVDLIRVMGSEELSAGETVAVKQAETQLDAKLAEDMGIKADRADQDEPGIKMLIPSFKANDQHLVLLELRVPAGTGSVPLATVHVKYKDMRARANATLKETLTLDYAGDKKASVASIDRRVKKNIMGFMTGEALMKAASSLQRGDIAGAVRVIDDQMTLVGVAAGQWKDEDLRADAQLLGQYKEVLMAHGQSGRSQELVSYLSKSLSYSAYQRLN